jgi:hypothetical protein
VNWHELLKDALIVHGILNCAVSLLIARNEGLSSRQKVGQLLVVWLVPVFGSLLIGMFLWSQSRSAPPTGYPSEPQHGPAGIGTVSNQGPSPPATGV